MLKILVSLVLLAFLTSSGKQYAASKNNNIFPNDVGVLDVTAPEFGAIPNDGKDDTAAIQKALNRYPSGGRIIYLPNGVYDISESLHWPAGRPNHSDFKMTSLVGQTRDGVIIRLADNLPQFQNPRQPRPVISTGFDPDLDKNSYAFKASLTANRFQNCVRNLTIDTGKNNPGAEGLNYTANNQGAVRSVTITGTGTTGLALTHGEVGPLLVEDVEIVGFNYGIRTNGVLASVTLQDITVRNQKIAGILNNGQVFNLVGFTSNNNVPAIINGANPKNGYGPGSVFSLINANIVGFGAANNVPAIVSAGFLYARNITTTGYKSSILSTARDAAGEVKKTKIVQYLSHSSSGKKSSLNLPIKPFPKLAWDAPYRWANVQKFGAIPNDRKDDTAAFQAAIDSGASTVVVPRTGVFTINGKLTIRGKVQRFIGVDGWLDGNGEIIVNNEEPLLIIQNLFIQFKSRLKWKNVSRQTVVYRDISHLFFESTGTGDLFLDDIVGEFQLLKPGQKVWARQLNTESHRINMINNGAQLWILGLKTERGNTKIVTRNGGITELIGALIINTDIKAEYEQSPLFSIENAYASFAGVSDINFSNRRYMNWIQDVQKNRIKKSLNRSNMINKNTANGKVLMLY